jgi:hypothetical protein
MPFITQLFKNTACAGITSYPGFFLLKLGLGGYSGPHIDWRITAEQNSTGVNADFPGENRTVYALTVRLNENYEGGQFYLGDEAITPPLYGGVVHDGWTMHHSEPVTKGERYIMRVDFLGILKT